MMSLQVVSEDRELLQEVADFLLDEHLIANALISGEAIYKINEGDKITDTGVYHLKAISKSLLFRKINHKLREKYAERTPLLYSEPIILIDPIQTEYLLKWLAKV
ncbi:hypothetical protein POV27_09450 [Aureisphaera galaxeae]|uniref:hypothetical protein n=1 Tax=Aureisphaera galaxeae TaxID=1538023 RepID=UPI002350A9D5|nr:hypothetical protein [Aureisphaera galaxeae]MDC8004275.1 hypothetical protein [Aureisphaera galaxeae]